MTSRTRSYLKRYISSCQILSISRTLQCNIIGVYSTALSNVLCFANTDIAVVPISRRTSQEESYLVSINFPFPFDLYYHANRLSQKRRRRRKQLMHLRNLHSLKPLRGTKMPLYTKNNGELNSQATVPCPCAKHLEQQRFSSVSCQIDQEF